MVIGRNIENQTFKKEIWVLKIEDKDICKHHTGPTNGHLQFWWDIIITVTLPCVSSANYIPWNYKYYPLSMWL